MGVSTITYGKSYYLFVSLIINRKKVITLVIIIIYKFIEHEYIYIYIYNNVFYTYIRLLNVCGVQDR